MESFRHTPLAAMKDALPVISLLVALLAVFFGPLISWLLSQRQLSASMALANKQIVAPMRQAWINSLRDTVAELASKSLHYYVSGFEERSDAEYLELTYLEEKIALLLNPNEEDHLTLERAIRTMVAGLETGKEGRAQFEEAHSGIRALVRSILKREWNRVKEPLAITLPSKSTARALSDRQAR